MSRYLHLSVIQVGVGQRVFQGQQIAISGASGFGSNNGYGAHLHLALWAPTKAAALTVWWDPHFISWAWPQQWAVDPYTVISNNLVTAPPPVPVPPKEYDELATKEEIEALVRKVVREEALDNLKSGAAGPSFVRAAGTPTVYYVHVVLNGGIPELVAHSYGDLETFISSGGSFGNVRDVPPSWFAGVKKGSPIKSVLS